MSGQQHTQAALYPGKDPVDILQEAGWSPGPVWTGRKSRPHRDSISNRPARSSVAIPTELPGPRQIVYVSIMNQMNNISDSQSVGPVFISGKNPDGKTGNFSCSISVRVGKFRRRTSALPPTVPFHCLLVILLFWATRLLLTKLCA